MRSERLVSALRLASASALAPSGLGGREGDDDAGQRQLCREPTLFGAPQTSRLDLRHRALRRLLRRRAEDLVRGSTKLTAVDVFVRDRQCGATERGERRLGRGAGE